MQGAKPLASPGLNPRGTGYPCRCGKRNGGACLSPRLPTLPLVYFPAPYPPAPPSPAGKGEAISLFRRGLRPRHPCIRPFATLTVPAVQVPSGVAQAGGRLPTLPFRHPQGGLPPLPPANPAFSLLLCPLSPQPPSPPGKGEIHSFLMQGASPLSSPGLNPRGTGSPCQSGTRRGVPSESPTRRNTDRTAFL